MLKMIKWTWKNSWSSVWCLHRQLWNTSALPSGRHNPRRSAIFQGCPAHPGPHTAASYSYQSSPWDMPISCWSVVAMQHFLFSTDIYHPQSVKTGWGTGVQRRLFWLDQRQRNRMTLRYSVQMTTTTSSSATSCCRYGVLDRQLQGWRELRWLCHRRESPSISPHWTANWIESPYCYILQKYRIIHIDQINFILWVIPCQINHSKHHRTPILMKFSIVVSSCENIKITNKIKI